MSSRGAVAVFAELVAASRRFYAEVSVMHLAGYMRWRQAQERLGNVEC